MTREEVVNSLAYNASKQAVLYSQEFSNDDTLQGEVIESYELGAEYGYQFAIDKACDWLENYISNYLIGNDCEIDMSFINDFKKAMEGE